MKLQPNANIPKFLQAVQRCRGSVTYVTPEGDNLDLKSALAQFVFAAVIAGESEQLHGEIKFEDTKDIPSLRGYLL